METDVSQQQFERFMAAQLEAVLASGLEPERWVELEAERFREEWEKKTAEEAGQLQ
jgi:hypothetical protein